MCRSVKGEPSLDRPGSTPVKPGTAGSDGDKHMPRRSPLLTPCTVALVSLLIAQQLFFASPHASAQGRDAQSTRLVVIRKVQRGEQSNLQKLPTLGRAQLAGLLRGSSVKVMTDQSAAATAARSRKVVEENRAAFRRIYQGKPALLRRLLAGVRQPEEPTITYEDRRGASQKVALLNGDALIRDALLTRHALESRENQAQIYRALYVRLQEGLRSAGAGGDVLRFGKLPQPAQVASGSVSQIDQAVAELVRTWLDMRPPKYTGNRPRRYPSSCAQEEGGGNGGDMTGTPCGAPSPTGLLRNYDWPLKPYNTCVRNQGRRGSCSAFAAVAGIESTIAVKYGRLVNLSEQDLYKHQKLDWFPIPPDFYGDGYSPAFSLIMQTASQYRFPFERDWDYNPARRRLEDDEQRKYTSSCVGYDGENCSDTNHQARRVCYRVETEVVRQVFTEVCNFAEGIPFLGQLGSWVCDTVAQYVTDVEYVEVCVYDTSIPGSSGFRVATPGLPFFDPNVDPQAGMELAKVHLDAMIPVVFCFTVPPSWGSPQNGFVAFRGADEKFNPTDDNPTGVPDGGHCVLMTGYVDNKNLPAGVTPGEGGGYFIVKNSWGCGYGDQGYAYVPYDWVKTWGVTMMAVPSVSL